MGGRGQGGRGVFTGHGVSPKENIKRERPVKTTSKTPKPAKAPKEKKVTLKNFESAKPMSKSDFVKAWIARAEKRAAKSAILDK